MDTIFGHCIAPGESVSGAYAVGMQMAKNHKEDFRAVAKDVLGLQTTNIKGTIECEAMIQDSNMSFNQFSTVKRRIFHATNGSFKMRYRQNKRKDLETGARLYGREPIYGEYKYESDDNGTVEMIRYWSTILTEDVQSSIESDIVNSTHCTDKDSKLPANDFPETVDVIVGMDHGPGALRGFAKILLASPELRKEKGDLSYGCPIVKLCHVQCKRDTYRVIKNTAIPLLNDSINHLQGRKCIIVTDKARQLVQACLVPQTFKSMTTVICVTPIMSKYKYKCPSMNSLIKHRALTCASTLPSKVSKCISRGTWAFYAAVLGKADSSGSWCTWCDAKKSWFGVKDLLQDAAKWTCEMLRKAEDFVEKGHQLGLMRDERHTGNIRNFEKQQRSQLNLQESRKRAKQEVKKERREKALNDS